MTEPHDASGAPNSAGEVPDGFTETTPLSDGPLPEALGFEADHDGGTGGYQGQSFDLADLTSGTLLQNGHEVTMGDLDDHAEGNCGGFFAMLVLEIYPRMATLRRRRSSYSFFRECVPSRCR